MTFLPVFILDHQAKGIPEYLCVVLQLFVPQLFGAATLGIISQKVF